MNTIIIIIIGVIFASFGQILLKFGIMGAEKIHEFNLLQISTLFVNVHVVLGLMSYALSSIFWLIALSREDLSFVYPFISLTFIIILFSSFFIFQEKIGFSRILGTSIIIIGLIILVRG